jgi:hypothetical protein
MERPTQPCSTASSTGRVSTITFGLKRRTSHAAAGLSRAMSSRLDLVST